MEASKKLSKDKHVMSVGKADKAKDKLLSNSKRKTKANANIVEGKTSHSFEEYEQSILPPVSSLLSKHGRSDNILAKGKKDSKVTLPIDPEQRRPTPIRPRKSCEEYLASDTLPGGKISLNSIKTQLHTGEQNKFEIDKQRIYGHPLFPILSLLLEKCEIATHSIDVLPPINLTWEARKLILPKLLEDNMLELPDDTELNDLMKRALQVLRIHMLELEKVHELCTDFCARYIACLKHKMQSENVLRNENGGYDSDEENSSYNQPPKTTSSSLSRHHNQAMARDQQVTIHHQNAGTANAAHMPLLKAALNKDPFIV